MQLPPEFNREVDQPSAGSCPRLKLIHGIMAEAADGTALPGQFYIEGADSGIDEVHAVIMKSKSMRILAVEEAEKKYTACRSDDGVIGVGDPGGPCNRCSLALWEGNQPPACEVIRTLVLWLPEQKTFVSWLLSRSALRSAGRDVQNLINGRGLGQCAVKLTSTMKKTRKGFKYLVPVVKGLPLSKDMLPPEEYSNGEDDPIDRR